MPLDLKRPGNLSLAGCGIACLLVAAMNAVRADEPAPPKSAKVPLELRLVAKKTEYALDPRHRPVAEFRNCFDFLPEAVWKGQSRLHPFRADELPPVPEVDIDMEIRNGGQKAADLWLGGDFSTVPLTLGGPGALNLKIGEMGAGLPRFPVVPARQLKLEPGAVHVERIASLKYRNGMYQKLSFWTKPGEYTLTADYHLAAGKDRLGGPKLVSKAIKLSVQQR